MPLPPFSSTPPRNFRRDITRLKKAGDNMTGTLDVEDNAMSLRASNGTVFSLTVTPDGALKTT